MKIKYLILCLPLFFIQACCKDSSFFDSNDYKDIAIIVQKKDINTNIYMNAKITSVVWLGVNYFQNVSADTCKGLSFNVKSNKTQFKITHTYGIDTVTFDYNWDPIRYSKGCYGENERMIRNVRGINASSNNGTLVIYNKYYTLKLK